MSEMIERMARAIYAGAYPKFKFENDAQHIRDHYRTVARAAIEAMRELPEEPGPRYTNGDYSRRSQAAMVDDALGEK
jgi:hypothetical protein